MFKKPQRIKPTCHLSAKAKFNSSKKDNKIQASKCKMYNVQMKKDN